MNPESPTRKVLIITYYWPPSGGAGVQRWLKFSKYLREFGWEPIIYTPKNPEAPAQDFSLSEEIPEGIQIIKTPIWEPYGYYKKLVGMKKGENVNAGFLSEKKKPGIAEGFSTWIRGNFFIPDARKFWIKPSVKFLIEYLRNNPVDTIVSTGPPHSTHMIALGIKSKLNIPWLADFRDPWTGIDFYHQLKLSRWADRIHHKMEKRVLDCADAITVVSSQMKRDFHLSTENRISVITNGYDSEDIQYAPIELKKNKFSITHIGSIPPSRNPSHFWHELAQKVREDRSFASVLEIKLVGKVDHSVIQSLEENGLKEFLIKTEYLPHKDVIIEMQNSQVLLLLINNTPNAKGILTGKIFEYFAAQRPILCIGPVDGDAAELLTVANSGPVVGFNDSKSLQKAITRMYNDYKDDVLFVPDNSYQKFSRKALTGSLAKILDGLISDSYVFTAK